MRLSRDYTLRLPASRGEVESRIRVFVPETGPDGWDLPVVLCTFTAERRPVSREGDPASEAPDALTPERVAAEVMIDEGFEGGGFVWISQEVSETEESFFLTVFAHYEIREIVREDGVWRREIGPPTWRPLDRRSVERIVHGTPDLTGS